MMYSSVKLTKGQMRSSSTCSGIGMTQKSSDVLSSFSIPHLCLREGVRTTEPRIARMDPMVTDATEIPIAARLHLAEIFCWTSGAH